jgi:hypothetical protein
MEPEPEGVDPGLQSGKELQEAMFR